MRYSRSFAAGVAAAVVAGAGVLGMSSAGASAGGRPPAATAGTARAAAESKCTGTSTVEDAYLRAAEVTVCAVTDGHDLTVELRAKCFVNFILGIIGTQYSNCTPSGYWSLYRGKTLVATGGAGEPVLYPGPGTYTLAAAFAVEAYKTPADGDEGVNGFTLDGDMSHHVALATAIAPGPRLSGSAATVDGARVVTVTNAGDQPAPSVHVYISDDVDPFAQQAISHDSRCDNEGSVTLCTLGSLAPGASASVTLTPAATRTCEEGADATPTYSWQYSADGSNYIAGDGPC
ncbi:MAG TPA: hypothetical protein VI365_01235 [Trebonia sp.]